MAILHLVHHSSFAWVLSTGPRVIVHSFGQHFEALGLYPERAWALVHVLGALTIMTWLVCRKYRLPCVVLLLTSVHRPFLHLMCTDLLELRWQLSLPAVKAAAGHQAKKSKWRLRSPKCNCPLLFRKKIKSPSLAFFWALRSQSTSCMYSQLIQIGRNCLSQRTLLCFRKDKCVANLQTLVWPYFPSSGQTYQNLNPKICLSALWYNILDIMTLRTSSISEEEGRKPNARGWRASVSCQIGKPWSFVLNALSKGSNDFLDKYSFQLARESLERREFLLFWSLEEGGGLPGVAPIVSSATVLYVLPKDNSGNKFPQWVQVQVFKESLEASSSRPTRDSEWQRVDDSQEEGSFDLPTCLRHSTARLRFECMFPEAWIQRNALFNSELRREKWKDRAGSSCRSELSGVRSD